MNADSTLFSNNDLSEPSFGGQVIATSKPDDIIPHALTSERRTFIRIAGRDYDNPWRDQNGLVYKWSDLRDIVILNRGI